MKVGEFKTRLRGAKEVLFPRPGLNGLEIFVLYWVLISGIILLQMHVAPFPSEFPTPPPFKTPPITTLSCWYGWNVNMLTLILAIVVLGEPRKWWIERKKPVLEILLHFSFAILGSVWAWFHGVGTYFSS